MYRVFFEWVAKFYWQRVDAQVLKYEITKSAYVTKGFATNFFVPIVFFEYGVGGKIYKGKFSYDSRFFSSNLKEAKNFAEKIKNVKIYYKPNNPSQFLVSKPHTKSMIFELKVLTILLIISIFILIDNIF